MKDRKWTEKDQELYDEEIIRDLIEQGFEFPNEDEALDQYVEIEDMVVWLP